MLISSPIPSTIACCDGVAVLPVVKSCLDEGGISWINCSSGSDGEALMATRSWGCRKGWCFLRFKVTVEYCRFQ